MKAFFVAIGAFCACCSARVPAWAAPPANQAAADNVCSYIAAAYNRGDRDKLWGYPDPVDIAGDGKLRHIYIIEQGTAHVSSIIASTSALSPEEQQAAFSSEVNFYGSAGKDMDLDAVPHIFQFNNAYYVVYEENAGPYDVVKPYSGEICRFKRSFAPALHEDQAPRFANRPFSARPSGDCRPSRSATGLSWRMRISSICRARTRRSSRGTQT
jgi:hypothetical protein